MRRLFFLALVTWIQGCMFDSEKDGVCGAGVFEFTRFTRFNEKDSAVLIVVVDSKGDTSSVDINEFDSSTGYLKKNIWIFSQDTICKIYRLQSDQSTVISTDCSDSTRKFSITTLNEDGSAKSIGLYSGTTIYLEIFMSYDDEGNLVQVESILDGEKYVSAKFTYGEKGVWKTSEEFDRNGGLVTRSKNEFTSSNRTKVSIFDKTGKLVRWEIGFLDSRGRVERSISCASR